MVNAIPIHIYDKVYMVTTPTNGSFRSRVRAPWTLLNRPIDHRIGAVARAVKLDSSIPAC